MEPDPSILWLGIWVCAGFGVAVATGVAVLVGDAVGSTCSGVGVGVVSVS